MFLGNDLVHWSGSAARQKATLTRRTRRFIERVLHEREHPLLDRLGVIGDSCTSVSLPRFKVLWALWAAKEAAFKAAVKSIPGLPFSPRSIRIEFFQPARAGDCWPLEASTSLLGGCRPLAYGLAHVRNQVYKILWEYHEDFVHALALGPWTAGPTTRTDRWFRQGWKSVVRNLAPIPSHPEGASGAVRRIARQLLSVLPPVHLRIPKTQIVRDLLPNGRLGPPAFNDDTLRVDLDLTMTHDGPWGAAGLLQRDGRQQLSAVLIHPAP